MSDFGPRRTPRLLRLYMRLSALAGPLAMSMTRRRARRGKEDPARIGERRGEASIARPEGPLVWVHAASVGEFNAVLPLVRRLLAEGPAVLVTTVTRTAAALAAERLPDGAVHQYIPWDVPASVDRFLGHWRPDLALFAESELWPNLILRAAARGTPLVQVNARMSERSFRGWGRAPGLIAALLGRFDSALAQSVGDARRLKDRGAPRVETVGNLKFDSPPPPVDPAARSAFEAALAGRPMLLAASTHEGEDEAVITAFAALRRVSPSLLLAIAPRHPQRGEKIAALAAGAGFAVERRSLGAAPTPATDVYVADTIGEMGLFYSAATLAFIGGSLIPHGGQNPIEPAKLGAPTLHGPHVGNFADVYAALGEARATVEVADAAGLAAAAERLLAEPQEARDQAARARTVVEGLTGALDRTMDALRPYLFEMKAGRRPPDRERP